MKVLITRPRSQATDFADKLLAAGFEPIYFPVIEIQPVEENIALERALSKLGCYEWIVFTSVNAVDVVFQQFPGLDWSEEIKVAAIGPKTANALKAHNVRPDYVPEDYIAEAILPGLGDLRGKWVLMPRAEIARKELPEAICSAGGVPHEITVYKTLPAQTDPNGLEALRAGVDVITFTSVSTVDNFVTIARTNELDPVNLPNRPLCACIGSVTEQAARQAGFQNIIVAQEYTTDGLIQILRNLEKS
jgi:uroporphyrinogen-III synthase